MRIAILLEVIMACMMLLVSELLLSATTCDTLQIGGVMSTVTLTTDTATDSAIIPSGHCRDNFLLWVVVKS